jgi:Major Facilitator Superfamily.
MNGKAKSFIFANKNSSIQKRNTVKTLGWVAFFGSFGQDMIRPILPIFYSSVLGMDKSMIGFIEGSLTTMVSVSRILAGTLSDKLGKKKGIVFTGYLFSAISRFLLGAVYFVWQVVLLRLLDGIGKGTKDAPRDALVAKASQKGRMGFSFGYQQMLDTFGSVVGPLFTTLMLYFLSRGDRQYRIIFYTAGAISCITILLVLFFVKEERNNDSIQPVKMDFKLLKGDFLFFLVTMMIFSLGNSSDSFLILRAQNIGISPIAIPVVYAAFSLVYGTISLPVGSLSDKIGRIKVMKIGWIVYILSYIGFAFAYKPWHIWIVFTFYGLYYAATEGIAKALIARIVPGNKQATAFGFFNASIGIMALPANLITGYLWDLMSPCISFLFSVACASIALFMICFSKLEKVP